MQPGPGERQPPPFIHPSPPCPPSLHWHCIAKRPLYACFVDLQNVYDTVHHDRVWSKLYACRTLSVKVTGTPGAASISADRHLP